MAKEKVTAEKFVTRNGAMIERPAKEIAKK